MLISLRFLNSGTNSGTKCQPCLYLSNGDRQSHASLESIQSGAFCKRKCLPTKELLVLNKGNLLERSTTRVNQYIHTNYIDT